jgi:alkanesulfonate monooxygenase SsuD/methylene tetrahydromethanopterin reductase-like flavin-dependent oxidoreductase (luciferase family)
MTAMEIGIVTPVLTALPGAHAAWERDASWHDVVTVVQAADRLGYSYVTCSEHVAVPTGAAEVRGGRYWDPLATFGYLAAVTEQIRLATYVLVLGYHHPLAIAKRYGSLDVVSGGRLILGLGVGTLREEFDLLGVPFDDFADMVVEPHSLSAEVPIWIGGRTSRSLRRAVERGTGWAPFGLSTQRIAQMLTEVELPPRFDVVLQPARPVDPQGAPAEAAGVLAELSEAGATHVSLRLVHHSPAHFVEQLEAARGFGA